MKPSENFHLKYKICVSGAAKTDHCNDPEVLETARKLGKEIAEHDTVLLTGATSGFPLWAAKGAKEVGGFSLGFSPALSEKEHVEKYKLPTEYFDSIFYTGFGYSGRNLILARSADAVIVGCGRIGTVNEFTVAFEDKRPLGILEGSWATDEVVKYIIKEGHRPNDKVVYDSDPKALVEKVLELVQKEKVIEI